MTEWWTYGLSDFLMFSPQTYWRLVARHNAAWWPAQGLGLAAAMALVVLARLSTPGATRTSLVLLAIAWAWVGWAFHWQRYAEIFLAAPWTAAACGWQSLVLLVAAGLPMRDDTPIGRGGMRAGVVLIALAALYPVLAPATGHAWSDAEVFGFLPDPTALATVGALFALPGLVRRARVLLAIVPVLSLLLGAATRWLLAQ